MIHHISLRTSAQATEDPEKVRSSLQFFLPPEDEDSRKSDVDIISESITSGYYGNQIIVFEARLHRKKQCQYLIDVIKQHLGNERMSQLIAQLPQRIDDDCNLYIRFDKQKAYLGRLIMTRVRDPLLLKIKLKAYPATKEKGIQVAQSLFTMED